MIPRTAAVNASVRRQQAARRAAQEQASKRQNAAATTKPTTIAATASAKVIVVNDEAALAAKDEEFLSAQLHKYDADHSGYLDVQEVTSLMRDLNDGIPPPQEEVAAVIKEADKSGDGRISADELSQLIHIWFSSVDVVVAEQPRCGCCTVM